MLLIFNALVSVSVPNQIHLDMDSPLVTHVLNTEDGVPAARLALSLHRLDPQMALWNLITTEYIPFHNRHCQENLSLLYSLLCWLHVKKIKCKHGFIVLFRTTDENGHCPGLINRQDFTVGMYKLRYETGQYWKSLGQTSFYPYVEVSERWVGEKAHKKT